MAQNEIIKRLGLELPKTVVDDETGEKLPVDPQIIERAITIISRVQNDIISIAENISEFFGNKYYLYLGVTKDEAAETFFGMTPNSVRRFERIAQAYGSRIAEFAGLGITRMDAIAQLPEEKREELLNNKTLRLDDGTEIDLDEIISSKAGDIEKQFRSLRLKYSKLNTEYAESKEEHKAEIKELKREVEERENLLNIPPEERKFHKRITKVREARAKITEAVAQINAAFIGLSQIELENNNKEIMRDIEGFMILTARGLLDLEDQYGASLGYYSEQIKGIAK